MFVVLYVLVCFFVKYTATTEIYTYGHTLSLHDALPISSPSGGCCCRNRSSAPPRLEIEHRADMHGHRRLGGLRDALGIAFAPFDPVGDARSEEHTSELQSLMRISYAVLCLHKKITTTLPQTQLIRTTHTTTNTYN